MKKNYLADSEKKFLAVFGNAMKRKRIELGISQRKMTEMLGISRNTYRKYEQGTAEIGIIDLFKVCDILDFEIKLGEVVYEAQ